MDVREKVLYLQAILLFLMLVTALTNMWLVFGYIMALHLSLWFVIGIARNGGVKNALVIAVPTFLIWSVCFSLIVYYWQMFRGTFPEFTIAGMHPGFFILFPVMWLLLFIVTTLSYPFVFEKWIISEKDWEEFLKKAEVKEHE
jgi:hypothetical protein